jgi:hypothetical protein
MEHDGRLRVLDPEWFRGRRLLDVGCNEGVVTLAMATEFGCRWAGGAAAGACSGVQGPTADRDACSPRLRTHGCAWALATAPLRPPPHPHTHPPPPSRTDGVDIDPVLVGKAITNTARLREGLQQQMRDATSPANRWGPGLGGRAVGARRGCQGP